MSKKAKLELEEAYREAVRAYISDFNSSKTILNCSDCVYCAAEESPFFDPNANQPGIRFYCHFERPESDGGSGFEYPSCPGLWGLPCANFSTQLAGHRRDASAAKNRFVQRMQKARSRYFKIVNEEREAK